MRSTCFALASLAAAFSCEPARRGGSTTTLQNHRSATDLQLVMRQHHEAAMALQRAVAGGRLIEARELASWLAMHGQPQTDDMESAAGAISRAPDLRVAARLTGYLAGACGACHVAQGASPRFTYAVAPAAATEMQLQMQRHQWAANRLWEGLVGPFDRAWLDGASAMAETVIDLSSTTRSKPNEEVVRHADTIRTLSERALVTSEQRERAELFGEMLEGCASCHSIVRPRTVPRAPFGIGGLDKQ